jgi:hypothetical protein
VIHVCRDLTSSSVRSLATTQELEDMLLRYERQLKAETAARQAAEAAVAEALTAASAGTQPSTALAREQELLQQV